MVERASPRTIIPRLNPQSALRNANSWKRGVPGGPGRPKGSKNKATRQLKENVLMAAELVGEDGKGRWGLLGYLKSLAKREPRTFATLLVKAIPMELAGDPNRPIVIQLDPNQLDALSPDRQEMLREVLKTIQANVGENAAAMVLGAMREPTPVGTPGASRYAQTLQIEGAAIIEDAVVEDA